MKDIKLLIRFYQYLKPYRKLIFISIFCIPITIACSVFFPLITVDIFKGLEKDSIEKNELFSNIQILIFVIIVGYLSKTVFTLCLQIAGLQGLRDLRAQLFNHTIHLPRKYYDRQPNGVILAKHTSDFEALGESMAIGALGMLTDFLEVIILTIVLMLISFKLTVVILLVIPPLFFIVSFLRKKLRAAYQLARKHLANSTGYLQECLNGIKTIQLYSAEDEVKEKYGQGTLDFCLAQKKSNIYDALLFSIIEGITAICLGLLLWVAKGAIDVSWLSIGVLLVFMHSFPKLFVPIRDFTQHLAVIQRSLAALEHIFGIIDEKSEPYQEENSNSLSPINTIEFKNVTFRYGEDQPDVLKGITFKLEKGETLALVGSTGSGKSTIVRLLTRIYDQYQGSILINDIELNSIPKKQINQFIASMNQDTFLFNRDIAFNIGLNRTGVTEEHVTKAAQTVYADTFIEELEGKYEFKVENSGENLSAGQAQLISFARTIAANREVIVLDEATSTVDSITEQTIEKATKKLFEGRTVIAIAHRLSTIRQADLILVMENGIITERGNHDSLYQQKGLYRKMIDNFEENNKP